MERSKILVFYAKNDAVRRTNHVVVEPVEVDALDVAETTSASDAADNSAILALSRLGRYDVRVPSPASRTHELSVYLVEPLHLIHTHGRDLAC